jgi:hypothetical protein
VITSATENTMVEAIRNSTPRSGEEAGGVEASREEELAVAAGEEVMTRSKNEARAGAATSLRVSSLEGIALHKILFSPAEKCKLGTYHML